MGHLYLEPLHVEKLLTYSMRLEYCSRYIIYMKALSIRAKLSVYLRLN